NATKTGNDPGAYVINSTFYAPAGFPFGGATGLGQDADNRVSTSDLKPEFTTAIEAGIEMQFFRSRLTSGITLYQSNSTDQIVPINTAPSSGATSMWTNIGEIQNQGIEVDLNGKIIASENFSWDVGINYSTIRSEVISLKDGVPRIDIGGYADAQIVAEVG